MTATLIEKEEIEQYKFVPAEVDRTDEFASKLSGALRLGNEFKSKVALTFMTEDGAKRVETTVWSLTEKYIVLKAGVLIPMRSLINVSY
ncbi:hypothetical protein M8998_02620 [Sphingobacterium sp. lm-10]|uniref:hypothetical protein n=1 Tax=Sphingobacterium sp. lm-10 TaxID=2944904 RepID=UPI00202287CB|nr:hypothetical protein [Sphingobacterium sp. lm-10]MCL7986828.1 hypothetical protein [Sphingobacterium sp. lm-10]